MQLPAATPQPRQAKHQDMTGARRLEASAHRLTELAFSFSMIE